MYRFTAKYLFLFFGHLSLLLGTIGIILPVLPTTPFVLLAAFFYSKGSDKLHNWLLMNKYFGHMIKDWEQSKIIGLRAKIYSTSMIVPLFSYTLYFVSLVLWIKIAIAAIGLSVLLFIWTRPSKESETIKIEHSQLSL
jgi:uncharacterized protein